MSFEFSGSVREVRPIAASGGFTLIELLVAFGVGLVLLAVLVTLFASNSSNQNSSWRPTTIAVQSPGRCNLDPGAGALLERS